MRDIIVIGASLGGVEALQKLTADLPLDFPASLLVVLHHLPSALPVLPQIQRKESRLPVCLAQDKEPIRPGHIYIAPPNYHLLVKRDYLQVISGPREHFFRPAINPLFRSAALAYKDRVIGIILSGPLDDGVAGLWEIKRHGGLAIVQSPADAKYPSMPKSALENVEVDHAVNMEDMAALLSKLVRDDQKWEQGTVENEQDGKPVGITCPDCRGELRQYQLGPIVEYRCRVGHAHSARSMAEPHQEAQERALWAALVALEEGVVLSRKLANLTGSEAYARQAEDKARHAEILKNLITSIKMI